MRVKKMFKKIKDYIVKNPASFNVIDFNLTEEQVLQAIGHYCEKCKQGFKSKAGKASHVAIKHKNG